MIRVRVEVVRNTKSAAEETKIQSVRMIERAETEDEIIDRASR